MRPEKPSHDGVLVVDKPTGPTSHDVVFRLRRALGQKRIGHAGTLDPMASGVLVVLLGEATKLGPYLTAHDKRYDARVVFGRATDTLDAQGKVTLESPVPAWLDEELRAIAEGSRPLEGSKIELALAAERTRKAQTPPAFSAIKVSGERSYDRARRGEDVELEDRPVEVFSVDCCGAGSLGPSLVYLDVSIDVSKGYYVRSLARDLGQTLGVPAHLGALRRTRSGPFTLESAVALDAPRETLAGAVLPLSAAVRLGMPTAVLTAAGVLRASQGKRLNSADFEALPPPSEGPIAWLSSEGRLVAVGIQQHDEYVVQRGFTDPGGADVG